MLKENNEKWKIATLEEKEDCLNFMLEILNIKVSDEVDQDDIDRQMVLINNLISSQFQILTAPEIKEAFQMYVSRKLTVKVFRLVDCVAVGEILTSYIEFRNQAIQPFLIKRQNLLNAPIEKSEAEKQKIFNEFIKMVYDEVLQKGYCDEAWYLFKKLEDNNKIEISNEEKTELYKKELAIYVPAERKRIIKQNPLNGKHLVRDFEKTYEGKKRLVYVQNRCRSIIVSEYILKTEISFEDLLQYLI